PLHSPLFSSTTLAPSDLYPLSLHDALPIWPGSLRFSPMGTADFAAESSALGMPAPAAPPPSATRLTMSVSSARLLLAWRNRRTSDRKSTRLNSSHVAISYAVFCLKKKKKT